MQNTPNYNYNLPEYSDSADIAVLNANFSNIDANEYRIEGKLNALGNDIALPYDNTATYSVGDYVIYNNALYRCITAIVTAEDFDDTKWTSTTVMDNVGGGVGGIALPVDETEQIIGKLGTKDLYYWSHVQNATTFSNTTTFNIPSNTAIIMYSANCPYTVYEKWVTLVKFPAATQASVIIDSSAGSNTIPIRFTMVYTKD